MTSATSAGRAPFPVLTFAFSGLALLRKPAWLVCAVAVGLLGLAPWTGLFAWVLIQDSAGSDHRSVGLEGFFAFVISGLVWALVAFGFQTRVFRNVLGISRRSNLLADGWGQLTAQQAAKFYAMGPILIGIVAMMASFVSIAALDDPWRWLAPPFGVLIFLGAILYTAVRRSLIGVVAYARPGLMSPSARGWDMTRGMVIPLAVMLVVSWLVSVILVLVPAAAIGAALWAAGVQDIVAARYPELTVLPGAAFALWVLAAFVGGGVPMVMHAAAVANAYRFLNGDPEPSL